MSLAQALKNGNAIEVELDTYLLDDNRSVKYDRYRKGACKWVCDDGYAYRNFCEAYHQSTLFAKQL